MSWASIGSFLLDIAPLALQVGATAAEYKGSKEAAEGTEKGTQEQIAIEKLNREYAQKIFDENIERQKPFYEAGLQAGIKYPDAITNKLDPTQSGAYKTQLGLIEKDLEGAPEYVREDAISRLGAVEGEKQKSRLLDLQKIGLGASESAGTSGMNLGTMLAQSYGLTGNVAASGEKSASDQKQSAWNVAASQLSGIPAYLASGKDTSTNSNAYVPPTRLGSTPWGRTSQPGGMGGF